jgi:hypothetical protein
MAIVARHATAMTVSLHGRATGKDTSRALIARRAKTAASSVDRKSLQLANRSSIT